MNPFLPFIISFAIFALTFLLESDNHVGVWLTFDGKLRLRIKLYLINDLLHFEYLISNGRMAKSSPGGRKLLSLIFPKDGNKQISIEIAEILEKSRVNWSLRIRAGTDDAAQTALICGALTAVLTSLALASLRFSPRQTQKISVIPVMAPCAKVKFSCMFSLRTGHIIVKAIKETVRYARKSRSMEAKKA